MKLLYHFDMTASPRPRTVPKYQQVYDQLFRDILNGRLKPGDRLPSEAALVKTFGASRITVGRAVRDLQREGLVERRAGSGSYIRQPKASVDAAPSRVFGLLIPDLGETEIFEPICQGLTSAPAGRPHAVIWGGPAGSDDRKEADAWERCRQYIERRVAGVFFAPLELTPSRHEVNERITRAFDEACIPVVLLDRSARPYGQRDQHDLVGIDNRRAGYRITEHLLKLGARRVAFASLRHAASTVDARLAGYREALHVHGAEIASRFVVRFDAGDSGPLMTLMADEPDAIVCANDRTAGLVMQVLLAQGYDIPGDIRLVGIDDVQYASLLPVPLTTLRQPCRDIGVAAMAAMLDRIAQPDLPARDILLHPTLIVRRSCGALTASAATSPDGSRARAPED